MIRAEALPVGKALNRTLSEIDYGFYAKRNMSGKTSASRCIEAYMMLQNRRRLAEK
jgi:hypothetical protein